MPPRPYRMARREQAAEETRRRIVEAVFALHSEQGVAATSMKQIAQRAGVAVGSVYHHFPTYEDAIGACGALVRASFPFPDARPIEAEASLAGRIAAFVAVVFDYYAGFPPFEAARGEQHVSPAVRTFFEDEEANRRALARAALRAAPALPASTADILAGLCDVGVYNALVRAGHAPKAAARQVAQVLTAWLEAITSTQAQGASHAHR